MAIEFINDFTDDPTAQFSKLPDQDGLADRFLGPPGRQARRHVRGAAPCGRSRGAPGDRAATWIDYAITTAYNVPLLWYQRIIVSHKKIKNWDFSPSQYILQDLSEVWLDPIGSCVSDGRANTRSHPSSRKPQRSEAVRAPAHALRSSAESSGSAQCATARNCCGRMTGGRDDGRSAAAVRS